MPLIRKDPASTSTSRADSGNLQASDAASRFTAARDLSGDPSAVTALSQALTVEADAGVREAILTSLARIGDSASVAAVVHLLRSDDAGVRTGALDALRLMPRALSDHLAELLEDADPDVRLLACDLARNLPADLATRLLAELLERENEVNVCAAALDVLAEVGEPAALASLETCRKRFADERFLIFAIGVTAERIRGRPAAPRG